MIRQIYSTYIFETQLTGYIEENDSEDDVFGHAPVFHKKTRQRFECVKTSKCLVRYILEDGDDFYLAQLSSEALDARLLLANGTISMAECQRVCDRHKDFADMVSSAKDNIEYIMPGIEYIERMDDSSQGTKALFHISEPSCSQDIPCKVGEMLEYQYDKELNIFKIKNR